MQIAYPTFKIKKTDLLSTKELNNMCFKQMI